MRRLQRSLRHLALFVAIFVATATLPGCGLFGIGCRSFLADTVGASFDLCLLFSGDCCADKKGNFYQCGELDDPFQYVCGGFGDNGQDHGCFCFGFPGSKSVGDTRQSIEFATYNQPSFTFDGGLPFAGTSPVQRVTFDVIAQSQQTFEGAVTYSSGYAFNGFTALGAAGTQIGSYGFDFDANGVVDIALPLRALDADTAYVDINLDGQATDIDPTVHHVANVPDPGAHTFNLLLPAGGDAAPKIARAPRAFQVQVEMFAGVLRNPTTPGSGYSVKGTFTSVDPDTGDASDGANRSPFTLSVPAVPVTITPSPLAFVDHFLCYKTKPSKGNVCNASATVNAGGLCTSDAECGGIAASCVKNKLAKGIQETLADQYSAFAARAADVKKADRLCTPVETNGEARHDTVTHLRSYAIKDAKGSAKRTTLLPVQIVNQLGSLAVQVKAPDTLLEPAAKALGAPAPVLGANTVDRYDCYKAKSLTKRCAADPTRACKTAGDCGPDGPCLGKFPKGLQVTLVDQFTTGKRFDVTKPSRLCAPALADGDPIQSPGGLLMCYKIKAAAGEPKHTPIVGTIHTTTQLLRERLDTVVEDEVCIPSLDLSTGING